MLPPSRLPLVAAAVAALLVFVGGASLLWQRLGARVDSAGQFGVIVPAAEVGGPFELVDHHGRIVTDASFRGRHMLILFGFTFCPDVCPTDLNTIALALQEIGPLAARIQPLFVSIDPERDTPPVLAAYVRQFHPDLVGLTGTPAQVAAAAKAFRVYYAKGQRTGDSYLMDHSAFSYLMGPDGKLVALFRAGMAPEQLAAALRSHLK